MEETLPNERQYVVVVDKKQLSQRPGPHPYSIRTQARQLQSGCGLH